MRYRYRTSAGRITVKVGDAAPQNWHDLLPGRMGLRAATLTQHTPSTVSGVVIDGAAVAKFVVVGSDESGHGWHIERNHYEGRHLDAVDNVAVQAGDWSDNATWSLGHPPTASEGARVPAGIPLRVSASANTSLTVTQGLLVNTDGDFEVDLSASPSNTFTITIADAAINTSIDPNQYGHSVIGLGRRVMKGAPKTHAVRMNEVTAGATTLTFRSAVTGWLPGDRLVLPDTRQHTNATRPENGSADHTRHIDLVTVATVAGDGLSCTLTAPTSFAHEGARDKDGNIDYYPPCCNLTRNVKIESANVNGTRGMTLDHGRAEIDIEHVEHHNLGRSRIDPWSNASGSTPGTNQQGRYPIHAHHLIGPLGLDAGTPQFTYKGCPVWTDMAVADSDLPRWALAVHGAHYGLVQDCVGFNVSGATFVTEDGSEYMNEFDNCYALRVPFTGTGEVGRGDQDVAHTSSGLWFGSYGNKVTNCYANDCFSGYMYIPLAFDGHAKKLPAYKGADPYSGAPSDYVVTNIRRMSVVQFDDNEAGGTVNTGITLWKLWNDGFDRITDATPQPSYFNRLAVWHAHNQGYYNYMTDSAVFDGYVVRGSFSHLQNRSSALCGMAASDYVQHEFTLVNGDVQGCYRGYQTSPLGNQTVEDTYFCCYMGIHNTPIYGAGTDARMMPTRDLIVRNCTFDDAPSQPTFGDGFGPQGYLDVPGNVHAYSRGGLTRSRVYVYDWDGVPGDDFRVYAAEQAGDAVVPLNVFQNPAFMLLNGSPVEGLTNDQLAADYGYLPDGPNGGPGSAALKSGGGTTGSACWHAEIAPADAGARPKVVGLCKDIP
jgi:hypothetical protein